MKLTSPAWVVVMGDGEWATSDIVCSHKLWDENDKWQMSEVRRCIENINCTSTTENSRSSITPQNFRSCAAWRAQPFAIICPVTIGCTASYFRMNSQSSGRLMRGSDGWKRGLKTKKTKRWIKEIGKARRGYVITCKDASYASAQRYSVLLKMEVCRWDGVKRRPVMQI